VRPPGATPFDFFLGVFFWANDAEQLIVFFPPFFPPPATTATSRRQNPFFCDIPPLYGTMMYFVCFRLPSGFFFCSKSLRCKHFPAFVLPRFIYFFFDVDVQAICNLKGSMRVNPWTYLCQVGVSGLLPFRPLFTPGIRIFFFLSLTGRSESCCGRSFGACARPLAPDFFEGIFPGILGLWTPLDAMDQERTEGFSTFFSRCVPPNPPLGPISFFYFFFGRYRQLRSLEGNRTFFSFKNNVLFSTETTSFPSLFQLSSSLVKGFP